MPKITLSLQGYPALNGTELITGDLIRIKFNGTWHQGAINRDRNGLFFQNTLTREFLKVYLHEGLEAEPSPKSPDSALD